MGAFPWLSSSTSTIRAASSLRLTSRSLRSLSSCSARSLPSSAFFAFFQYPSRPFFARFIPAPLIGAHSSTSGESGLRTRRSVEAGASGEASEVSEMSAARGVRYGAVMLPVPVESEPAFSSM